MSDNVNKRWHVTITREHRNWNVSMLPLVSLCLCHKQQKNLKVSIVSISYLSGLVIWLKSQRLGVQSTAPNLFLSAAPKAQRGGRGAFFGCTPVCACPSFPPVVSMAKTVMTGCAVQGKPAQSSGESFGAFSEIGGLGGPVPPVSGLIPVHGPVVGDHCIKFLTIPLWQGLDSITHKVHSSSTVLMLMITVLMLMNADYITPATWTWRELSKEGLLEIFKFWKGGERLECWCLKSCNM